MALAYRAHGTAGLALLKAGLVFAPLVLVWTGLRGARVTARVVVVVLLGFGTLHMWATIRPQLWTFLSVAILCRILSADRPAWRWWLPPLFAFWVNCHGGWVVGFGVLLVWAAVTVLQKRRELSLWAAVLTTTLVATLCNPYGWGLWQFLGQTVRMTRSIEEWGSLWGTPVINWIPWFAALGGGLWLVRRFEARHLRVIAVLAMLAFASARVMRIESLFILSAAILLAPWIVAQWPIVTRREPLLPLRARQPLAAATLVISISASVWIAARALDCIPIAAAWAPDIDGASPLEHAAAGRLVTYFDWGEYAIWHFGSRLRVSIDGRRETIYSEARLLESDAVLAGTPEGFAALDKWRAEYVWLPAKSQDTKSWLAAHGYRIDVETAQSFLAVRKDLPVLLTSLSGRRSLGTTPCFP
jgi:hypothetical protein